jgi:hypothetical protein
MRRISMTTRDELIAVTAHRYRHSTKSDRGRILDEFAAITGYHRKHAMRLLRGVAVRTSSRSRPERRRYDAPIREALIVLWEAADRICGKRLKPLLPVLLSAMERHSHLQLEPQTREGLMAMSSATIDRALKGVRDHAGSRGRRRPWGGTALRRSIPVRTFSDWNDPAPGFCEADLVAHSGPVASGSFIQTLVVTDIATGWTECAPLLVREQTVLLEVLTTIRKLMPFPLLGFDTDNDTVFLNETVRDYCAAQGITFTRCRPYRKNDQAWVEQKNGVVVRRAVGYRRYQGLEAASLLAQLYASMRLFVNVFQPSFKLAGKEREGARVRKRYHPPATPLQRLMADLRTPEATREALKKLSTDLDPVRLLRDIRALQEQLVAIADQDTSEPIRAADGKVDAPTMTQFLTGLRTAWESGEVRPTARPKPTLKRERRRPDPLLKVTDDLHAWFIEDPSQCGRELLEKLQAAHPGEYPNDLLRTVQRRLKVWRHETASRLVIGSMMLEAAGSSASLPPQ